MGPLGDFNVGWSRISVCARRVTPIPRHVDLIPANQLILKVTEFGKVFERVVISSEALKPYPQRKHQTKSQIAINTAPGLKAGTLVARPDQSISLDRQTDRPFELAGAQHGPI
jgi:hypothetical protein